MFDAAKTVYEKTLAEIRDAGLYKEERIITTPQGAQIRVAHGEGAPEREVLNFCANNYLGLSSHPAGHRRGQARDRRAWLRPLERALHLRHAGHPQGARGDDLRSSSAPRTPSSTASCFDANGGLFETLLGEEDAIISDALNHASIIDGIRLCKAERHRYPNGDMDALEEALKKTQGKRLRMVATDGVFSMDGYLAKLEQHLRSRRASTARWSWSTTRTRPASSARPAAERPSTSACSTASTS